MVTREAKKALEDSPPDSGAGEDSPNGTDSMTEESKMVDPHELLKGLSTLLGKNGDVKGKKEMERILSLMKEANKLVSRCVYINILRATKGAELIEKFVATGGWDLLNDWLGESKEDNNVPFLMELLKLYQQIPISVALLKQNSCAKTIKTLIKSADDENLKTLASDIVDTWMKRVRGKSSSTSSDKSSSKKKHHHHHHGKDKDSKSSAAEDKSSSSNPKSVERTNSTSKKESPPPPPSSSSASSNQKSDSTSEVTSKPRPKTVKTVPTKFRSTGLEQESHLPPAKKKSSSADKDKPAVKRISSLSIAKSQPPEKRARPTMTLPAPVNPLTIPASLSHLTSSNTSPVEIHGRIKLIPARPKPPDVQVYESSGFMDALCAAPSGAVRKKKKVPTATLR